MAGLARVRRRVVRRWGGQWSGAALSRLARCSTYEPADAAAYARSRYGDKREASNEDAAAACGSTARSVWRDVVRGLCHARG